MLLANPLHFFPNPFTLGPMRLFRAHRVLRRALMVVGVLVAYQAVCPSVCLAARAHMADAHACCPDGSPQEAPADLPPCCEGHGQVVLPDGVATVAPFSLQGVAVLLTCAAHSSSPGAWALTVASVLPSSDSDRPLYLVHHVFRT